MGIWRTWGRRDVCAKVW